MKVDPYVHAALVLYGAGKQIDVESLKAVVSAAGVSVDEAKVKVLVDALKDVNLEEAIAKAAAAPVAAAPVAQETKTEEKKEEKEEKKEDDGAAGLAALFG
ncbi:MAG: 50S ribosomal protein P1 [Candidatus Anstonellales archaeon]